jgi:hypothetical protein
MPISVPSAVTAADQIDVVKLVGRGQRQALARHEQPQMDEPLGRVAVAYAAKAGDEVTLGRARRSRSLPSRPRS